MYPQLTVGERLKLARKSKGFTQDEVGEVIKVGKSQVSNIEKGNSELTRANAIVLSELLEVELNWLLHGEGLGPKTGFSQSVQAGRNVKGVTQAGGNISGHGDCERELAEAQQEIRHLKEMLQEKERLISILMKQQG